MHLELLKDLELMDFEGIYNVSSHPNTLYVKLTSSDKDWLWTQIWLVGADESLPQASAYPCTPDSPEYDLRLR